MFYDKLVSTFFGAIINPVIDRAVNQRVRVLDDLRDRPAGATESGRDRRPYDRAETLRDCLEAWRVNPLARRIVALTSQYVVGGGISLECKDEGTHQFLTAWWQHPLNRMPVRCFEWCDELTRSGELFVALSTDASGMSYVRAIPALEIEGVECAPNDLEQPVSFRQRAAAAGEAATVWPAYRRDDDQPDLQNRLVPAMLHYAINRPVGAQRGEPDLAPLLRWLSRYASWLEDRARLNRYRQSFLYWVRRAFTNEAERLARQAELNANPPNPGSILVSDESENWAVLHPKLDSFEAAEDGLSLKKMVCAGAGVPLHFLAEPEGATRTTAEQAGGPTFRHFDQRQAFFLWLIRDVAGAVTARRAHYDRMVNPNTEITVRGADISARDNALLAEGASKVVAAFAGLRDRGLIDDAELLRLAYRFAGEAPDVERLLQAGRIAGERPAVTGEGDVHTR
jgi:hypothetical protein